MQLKLSYLGTDETGTAVAAQPGTLRPGGRTARVRESVLAALQAALAETRYRDLTVEQVALRAGVAKTTVYRRWGSVEGLVLDLMKDLSNSRIPLPDTGDLDADLRELARGIVTLYQDPAMRAVIGAVVAAAEHIPEARQTLTEFFAGRTAQTAVIAERAVARGDLPPGTDIVEVIRVMAAPFYYRMFITGEPIDERVADRAAATAITAARSGLLSEHGQAS
jgi:AcrR family transcriptional regulator